MPNDERGMMAQSSLYRVILWKKCPPEETRSRDRESPCWNPAVAQAAGRKQVPAPQGTQHPVLCSLPACAKPLKGAGPLGPSLKPALFLPNKGNQESRQIYKTCPQLCDCGVPERFLPAVRLLALGHPGLSCMAEPRLTHSKEDKAKGRTSQP